MFDPPRRSRRSPCPACAKYTRVRGQPPRNPEIRWPDSRNPAARGPATRHRDARGPNPQPKLRVRAAGGPEAGSRAAGGQAARTDKADPFRVNVRMSTGGKSRFESVCQSASWTVNQSACWIACPVSAKKTVPSHSSRWSPSAPAPLLQCCVGGAKQLHDKNTVYFAGAEHSEPATLSWGVTGGGSQSLGLPQTNTVFFADTGPGKNQYLCLLVNLPVGLSTSLPAGLYVHQ